jgi:hypothetical protein
MTLDGRATDQDRLFSPRKSPSKDKFTVSAETRRLWEDAATTGERIDPTNAFFPYLRAVGLFANHQDDAACREMVRAGSLPRFEDYGRAEIEARWRLADAANRVESGSLAKLTIQSSVLQSHYALMHDAARLAIVRAIALEQNGQPEAGFAIRRAVERAGARMRTDSSVLVGSQVGGGIAATARLRPGGAPAIPYDRRLTSEQNAEIAVSHYSSYLQKIGHPEEIAWTEHDHTVSPSLQRTWKHSLELEPFNGILFLAALWAVSGFILGNLFFVVIFGGICALLCRTATVRDNLPLQPIGIMCIVAANLLAITYLAFAALPVLQTYLGASMQQAAAVLPLLMAVPQVMYWTIEHRNKKRKPKAPYGTLRGFAASALPVATVLTLLYVPLVCVIGRCEAVRLATMRQIAHHEGRAYAQMTGEAWPTYGPGGKE